jgi:hypothetical protein
MPNESRLRLPEKRPSVAPFAAMCGNQVRVALEVAQYNILSINRVHEVSGHFLSPVLDKNGGYYKKRVVYIWRYNL